MDGKSSDTYVHASGHELVTYKIEKAHTDGIAKIIVYETGKVRAGKHKFNYFPVSGAKHS